jgi:hypothetical protein
VVAREILMGAMLRGLHRLEILGVVILLVITATVGYSVAKTRAAVSPPGQQAAEDFKDMRTPQDGTSLITVDQEHGLICIESRNGKGTGGGCGYANSPNPIVSISGGKPSDPAQIVVVDAQRRIAVVRATVDGKQYEAHSQDGGFSVQMTTSHIPDELSAFDTLGNTLYTSNPGTTSTRANQAAKDQSQSDHP